MSKLRKPAKSVARAVIGAGVVAISAMALAPTAGASTDPVPFSWTSVNTEVSSPTPINLYLPTLSGPSGGLFFVGTQQVYGAPPGVSSSYTSFGIRIPL